MRSVTIEDGNSKMHMNRERQCSEIRSGFKELKNNISKEELGYCILCDEINKTILKIRKIHMKYLGMHYEERWHRKLNTHRAFCIQDR